MHFDREIVYMDGEFAKLSPNGIDLLSIALVKPNGDHLYLELDYKGECSDWVKENVLPHMTQKKVSKKEAVKKIKEFLGDDKPFLVAWVNQFDWMGVCRLFDVKEPSEIINDLPFFWIPIDVASVAYAKGLDPGLHLSGMARHFNINTSHRKKHNALDDTLVLKEIYEKMMHHK